MENFSVAPKNVFLIFGGIWVRDTVISTWIMMALIVIAAVVARRRWPEALEMLVDFLSDTISELIGRPAQAYLPFLGSLAIFIAVANVIGVVPVMVTPTRDINTPLALAVVVFFSVYYFGIRAKGAVGYLKDLVSPLGLLPLLLPLELIGQFSRTLSLTLRLFGNIISTEMIVAVIFALIPWILPVPLIGFSMITGVLQAYIFTVLASAYIGTGLQSKE